MALDEVCGRDAPAPPATHQRVEIVDRQGGDPQCEFGRPVEEAGDDQQGRPEHGAGSEPEDGGAQLWIVPARDHVEDDVERANAEVRDPEDEGIRSERFGRRERHDQHGAGRGEHRQANPTFLGVERVRQPGVGRPRPPQRGQQEGAAQQALRGLVRHHEPGDLGDGEDEDEVEEQFERRDPLLALERANVSHA